MKKIIKFLIILIIIVFLMNSYTFMPKSIAADIFHSEGSSSTYEINIIQLIGTFISLITIMIFIYIVIYNKFKNKENSKLISSGITLLLISLVFSIIVFNEIKLYHLLALILILLIYTIIIFFQSEKEKRSNRLIICFLAIMIFLTSNIECLYK